MSKLLVKRRHRYNGEEEVLYQGKANVNDSENLTQISINSDTQKIFFEIKKSEAIILVDDEHFSSKIILSKEKESFSIVKSELGIVNIKIQTLNIDKNDKKIILEYDIVDSGFKEGFLVTITMEE